MNVRQVVPRDAIPSIDDPEFGREYFGDDEDLVIALSGSPPTAYPVGILNYHEIANDTVAREGEPIPVAVTWCPLCASAVVYDRRVGGEVLEFGVSGKLADDDLVMYDRETGSEWKQSSGECIIGEYEGETLSVLPAATTTWEQFDEDNPDGVVLQPVEGAESEAASDDDTPVEIAYDDAPYADYFEGDGFGLAAHRGTGESRSWDREDLDPNTVVLGVEDGDEALGFPLPRVEDAGGVVRATVGDRDAVVFAGDDGIHAFADPGYEFEPADGGFRADGTLWDGATGEAEDGRELHRLPARRLFAFAWRDDHGPEAFY